jgi:D-tyrosyl-tRNA(Tyr) deacylase
MRGLIQRVKSASVIVEDQIISEIKSGILLFVALETNDNNKDFDYIIDKTLNLRIFENEEGLFDKSLLDVNGELLIVSQFTLYADTRRGRRPSFTRSMPVNQAKIYFKGFVNRFKLKFPDLKEGQFQAMMEVSLINDGPVTIMIDSNKDFY